MSRRMSSTPPHMTPYLSRNPSRMPSRAPSLHALSYMAGHHTMPHFKSPTHSNYSRHTLIDCSKQRGESEETEESSPWIFVSNDKTHHTMAHQSMHQSLHLNRKPSYF